MNNAKLFADVFRKDWIVRSGTVLVLVFMTITGWILFADFWEGKETAYTHMHCPVCEEEVIYSARTVGSECPSCGNGVVFVPTVGSIREGTIGPGTGGKLIVFLILSLVLVQGLAFLTFKRSKVLHQKEVEARNKLLICRCPYCKRKIGFRAAQAGTGGVCPRCKTAFCFVIDAETEKVEAS